MGHGTISLMCQHESILDLPGSARLDDLLESNSNAKVGGHVPLIHSIHLHGYILQKGYSF
jgi:hypothetical protein